MSSNREKETGIGYPKLSRESINLIVDSLIWSIRDRDLGVRMDLAEQTASDLTGFYTRRWGLPPAISGRVEQIRNVRTAPLPADTGE